MKRLIKTCLVKHKRILSLTKSTICTAVILSLAFTANLSALPIIFLDADTPTTGSDLGTMPLVVAPYGTITFVGEIKTTNFDIDFLNAGATGSSFDILGPNDTPAQTAELFFSFDVISIEFVYGGNFGGIEIEARDGLGNVLDSFSQTSTVDGMPAGPIILSGSGIRSLYWRDPVDGQGYAALDNITLIIPEAATILLLALGSLTLLKRR